MGTVTNGMTIVVRKDIEVPESLQRIQHSQRPIELSAHKQGSKVIRDTDLNNPLGELVMIKGIGNFNPIYFEEYVEPSSAYTLIVQTENIFREGGTYVCYDNVDEHTEEDNGVRITVGDTEYFHPWTFDGGIRTLIKEPANS